MSMNTARLALADVGGFTGEAHCYELFPPLEGNRFVTVFTCSLYGNTETVIVPARSDGSARSMSRLPGSISGFANHEYALFTAGYALAEPQPTGGGGDA